MPVFEAAREPEALASKPGGAEARRSTTIQSVSIAARFLDILAKADGPLPLGRREARQESLPRLVSSLRDRTCEHGASQRRFPVRLFCNTGDAQMK